ncbi:MAG: hypothetical protein V1753_12250 [Pseudomonadota bacterium]
MNKKAQATLEFTVVFIIMITLLFGLISIWKIPSDGIVADNRAYNASRVAAGSGIPAYEAGLGPLPVIILEDAGESEGGSSGGGGGGGGGGAW